MKMHVLSGGRLRMKKSVFIPEADRAETIELPVACYLLRHPQGNVLFDTGCHPGLAADPEGRIGAAARAMVPLAPPEDNVVTSLAAAGLVPADIDMVVNSHLHTDHCGCNLFFNRARFVAHAAEIAAARDAANEGKGYFRQDWDAGDDGAGFRAIDAQLDVFGDGRLVLLPLPGHSPGTLAGLVETTRSGRFLLAADTVSLRDNLDRGTIPRNTWNAGLFAASIGEVKRIEAAGATVLCGHDDAQWRTLRKGAEAYD